MDETTKLKQLRFISKTHRSLHDQRRRVELKVLFTTLSLYILAAFAVLEQKIKNVSMDLIIGLWILFLVLAIIAISYLWNLHKSNRFNLSVAEQSEDEIAKLIGIGELKEFIKDSNTKRKYSFWSSWWQMITIFIVAIGSALIITLVR